MSGTLTVPDITVKKDSYPAISCKNTNDRVMGGVAIDTNASPSPMYFDSYYYNEDTKKYQFSEKYYLPAPSVANGKYDILTTKTDVEGATAGYDLTKGTIEERLSSLGFKQGAITLMQSGTAFTDLVSKQSNILYKQGKYVYGFCNIDYLSTTKGYLDALSTAQYYQIGKFPDGFVPKTEYNFLAVAYVTARNNTTDFVYAPVTVVADDNGSLYITGLEAWVRRLYIHFGYETM